MNGEAMQRPNLDEVDLAELAAILWKRRKLIFFGTMAVTLLAAAISFWVPKTFRSEGVFQLGRPARPGSATEDAALKETAARVSQNDYFTGIPIPFYNSSSPQFTNPNRFQWYAGRQKIFTDKDLKHVRKSFQTAASISRWIKPVYAFTKENIRTIAQIDQHEVNTVIGVSLSYEAETPQDARKYVGFLGDYIRDCLLHIALHNYVTDEHFTRQSQLDQIENDFIEVRFDMQQNYQKLFDIKDILAKYPESAKLENWQLVSVQKGGFRFPSPLTQLVTLESTLAALRGDLSRLERKKEMALLEQEYFARCHDEINKVDASGAELLALLKSIQSEVFKNKDFSKDTVKETANQLSMDLQTYDLGFSHSRFVSEPTMPLRPIRPRKCLIILTTFLLAASFFIGLAWVLTRWQSRKLATRFDASRGEGG